MYYLYVLYSWVIAVCYYDGFCPSFNKPFICLIIWFFVHCQLLYFATLRISFFLIFVDQTYEEIKKKIESNKAARETKTQKIQSQYLRDDHMKWNPVTSRHAVIIALSLSLYAVEPLLNFTLKRPVVVRSSIVLHNITVLLNEYKTLRCIKTVWAKIPTSRRWSH